MNKPIKIHGGKHHIASWLVSLMPPRDGSWCHMVHPYFGGGDPMWDIDPEGLSEVVNDTNRHLVNLWRVLRAPHTYAAFMRQVEAQPVCEAEWRTCSRLVQEVGWNGVDIEAGTTEACVARAAWYFVHTRQSLAGRGTSFTGITRSRVRRGMNAEVSAWLTAVEGLPEVHARLKRVLILNRPAIEVIKGQDGPTTLFYCDPPYLHETRETTTEYGPHEMSRDDHDELLTALSYVKGRFILSGYHSNQYDSMARVNGWRCHEKQIANSASHQDTKPTMTECVWTNY